MIARRVAIRSGKKSDFADLVRYITGEQGKTERVGQVQVTNCQSDRPDVALTEVLNTQAQNSRAASDRTYHLVISFRSNEQPDGAILKAIEARICTALGYGEHQRVSAVHVDTDNLHIHIAINKIHPTRYTIHDPYNDHKTLGRMCEKLEREYGLEQDNHQARKRGAESRAADMENHAGVESLIGWIRRECLGQIQGAASWTELHQVMRSNGLTMHERGNGLVISAGEGDTVKASSVSRDISKGKLEERFGTFVASPERQAGARPERQYARQPMRSRFNTAELYARYRNEQAGSAASRSVLLEKARARKNRLIEAAKRSGRLKRSAISLIKGAGPARRLMYAAVGKTLLAEIAEINKQYFRERQNIQDKYRRRAWADWLREAASAGEQDALDALRARGSARGLAGNTVTGKGGQSPVQRHPGQDSVTSQGTIIYRVGASAVRDDGSKLKVSRGADRDGLEAALRMARERYGDRISVSGTAAFREQIVQAAAAARLSITFDDAALEHRRQQLTQHATGKETQHEQSKRGKTVAGGLVRSGAAAIGTARSGQRAVKPDAGRTGRQPPPYCQNRLRGLSELGVVRFEDGGAVLLPGHVPGHLEQQGRAADHGVRRGVPGTGVADTALMARDRYIAEREARRAEGLDIPRHAGYGPGNDGPAAFAGLRHVGGQALALLRRGGEIMVLPVDDKAEERLKRLAIGDAVTVRAGFIRKKGRSR